MGFWLTFTLVWRRIQLDYHWETWSKRLLTVDLDESGGRECDLQNTWCVWIPEHVQKNDWATNQIDANLQLGGHYWLTKYRACHEATEVQTVIETCAPLSQQCSLLQKTSFVLRPFQESGSVGWMQAAVAAATTLQPPNWKSFKHLPPFLGSIQTSLRSHTISSVVHVRERTEGNQRFSYWGPNWKHNPALDATV